MFPDFLIVRKNEHGNYEYGLLEPHRDDKKDNLAKAKGLVKYVQACPNVDRVQMLRKMKTSSGEKNAETGIHPTVRSGEGDEMCRGVRLR